MNDRVTFNRANYIVLNTLGMKQEPVTHDELSRCANRVSIELINHHEFDADDIPVFLKSNKSPNSLFNEVMAALKTQGKITNSPPRRGVVNKSVDKAEYYVTQKGYQSLLRVTNEHSIPVELKTAINMAAHREGNGGFNIFNRPDSDPVPEEQR